MTEIPDIGLVILEMALNQWAVLNQADMHFVALTVYRPFIDGTVAGNPADLTVYKDTNTAHDHTYYGNGCAGGTGSTTPCDTRIVQTADDDSQKNGTYYNFQAATDGTGAAIATDNTDSSDTFCPLGWQLPYSGTGGDYYNESRSWKKLFDTYNITYDDGDSIQATKISSYPFSYIRSGYYDVGQGKLYYLTSDGDYWSSVINSNTAAYRLYTYRSLLRIKGIANKTQGYNLRCGRILAYRRIYKGYQKPIVLIAQLRL